MASIPELMDGHITPEVECLDRLYLNGYIGRLGTPGGLVMLMRDQLSKPIPSPVVLGQITERLRGEVKAVADRAQIPIYPFTHKEMKDHIANRLRRERGIRDGIVFRRRPRPSTEEDQRTIPVRQGQDSLRALGNQVLPERA